MGTLPSISPPWGSVKSTELAPQPAPLQPRPTQCPRPLTLPQPTGPDPFLQGCSPAARLPARTCTRHYPAPGSKHLNQNTSKQRLPSLNFTPFMIAPCFNVPRSLRKASCFSPAVKSTSLGSSASKFQTTDRKIEENRPRVQYLLIY